MSLNILRYFCTILYNFIISYCIPLICMIKLIRKQTERMIYVKKKPNPPLFIRRTPDLNADTHKVRVTHPVYPHWHSFYEIELVISGKGYTVINNTKYPLERGTLTLITPADTHSIFADEDIISAKISFEKEFIGDTSVLTLLTNNHSIISTSSEEDFEFFFTSFSMLQNTIKSIKPINVLHSRLILESIVLFTITNGNTEIKHTSSSQIQKAINYIEDNFSGKLKLSDVAKVTYCSEEYLSTKFHKEVGITISNYILNKRLIYSKKLLTTFTTSMTDIATQAGFNSVSYFSRAFKKTYGISPSEYRKQLSESEHTTN